MMNCNPVFVIQKVHKGGSNTRQPTKSLSKASSPRSRSGSGIVRNCVKMRTEGEHSHPFKIVQTNANGQAGPMAYIVWAFTLIHAHTHTHRQRRNTHTHSEWESVWKVLVPSSQRAQEVRDNAEASCRVQLQTVPLYGTASQQHITYPPRYDIYNSGKLQLSPLQHTTTNTLINTAHANARAR